MESGSNLSSSEIDDPTKEKLKGDAIGDTLYRESFVLKTLLQLSDLNWNQDVEEEFCYLWDMTTEIDVCKYLFNLSFPSLASSALIKYDERRFVEILIGILANLLCANCEKKIELDDIKIVLNELETDDSLVLIQVNRFLIALAHIYDKLTFLTQKEVDKLIFILNNSTNCELLGKTLETVSKITEDLKLNQELINASLYEATLTGFETIFQNKFEFDNEESLANLKFLFQTVTHICVYINKTSDEDLLAKIQNCPKFKKIVQNLLEHFSDKENLFPVNAEISFYFNAIAFIFISIEYLFFSDMFINFCKMVNNLYNSRDELSEIFKDTVEIISYFVYTVDNDTILNELKKLPYKNGICVLNSLKACEKKLDFQIGEHLKYLFKEYK